MSLFTWSDRTVTTDMSQRLTVVRENVTGEMERQDTPDVKDNLAMTAYQWIPIDVAMAKS